jgi:hypothetical protein
MSDQPINEAARALGKKGGASKSEAKRSASRANLALARARRAARSPQPITIKINRRTNLTEVELREIVKSICRRAESRSRSLPSLMS